ncbi:5'-nucleotidase C-terminal domain-containing protein [Paenibacillus alkalitolerans]|uniref:5'-nucleotidase C-terminal domain-containing protein n=1 Tax=Paenibacillus alkalitolerans TaxID=2799335 RepID=UPI0018F57748|nr:5'-nucleotidase C-terminal domain-containing protein [Paenibacillus alkalitolerans]
MYQYSGKRVRRMLVAMLLIATLLSMLSQPNARAAGEFEVTVIFTNDTHAHLENVARRATVVRQIREEAENSILLDAGDVFSGTLFFNQYLGQADLEFMNKMGYDAMVPGNHEFDKGPKPFAEFVKKAEFPIVSANIDYSKEPELNPLYKNEVSASAAGGSIYPATVLEVGGEKIAVFGLTTPETAFLANPGENVVFKDEIETAKAVVTDLKAKGYDKIIALTHLGFTYDKALAEEVDGIDVIVGGHSHTRLDDPVKAGSDDEPTLIVQANEYGKYIGRLDVSFDADGKVTGFEHQLVDVDAQNDKKEFVIASDEEFAARLAELQKPIDEMKSKIVGKTDVALEGDRTVIRRGESNLGNLIVDGMLAKAQESTKATIAIQNGGGIRASIDAGDISLGEVLTVLPFGNTLVTLELTGEEIVAALENGVSKVEENAGRFPHVAGMKYTYSMAKPAGSRVMDAMVKEADGSYAPIDPKGTYIVATNAYVADGGDDYQTFKKAKDEGRMTELFFVDYDVFTEYLDKSGTVNPKVEGRITRHVSDLPADDEGFDDVQALAGLNVFPEFTGDEFRPSDPITRLDAALWVSRAMKLKLPEAGAAFADIAADHPSAKELLAVKDAGIFKGMPDGTFGPEATLTKRQAGLVFERAFGIAPVDSGSKEAVTRLEFAMMLNAALQK